MSNSCVPRLAHWAALMLLAGLASCDGCASSHGLPDAGLADTALPDAGLPDASLPDASLPDASDVSCEWNAACEWIVGEPHLLFQGNQLSRTRAGVRGLGWDGSSAWVVTSTIVYPYLDPDIQIWLNRLDADGSPLAPAMFVDQAPLFPRRARHRPEVLMGQDGGLVAYYGLPDPPEPATMMDDEFLFEELMPRIRAFDREGELAAINFSLDEITPWIGFEPLVGAAAGDSFLIWAHRITRSIENDLLFRVTPTGERIGQALPSPFSSEPLAARPLPGTSSALFLLSPSDDHTLRLVRVDATGRTGPEVAAGNLETEQFPLFAVDGAGERVAVGTFGTTAPIEMRALDGSLLNSPTIDGALPMAMTYLDHCLYVLAGTEIPGGFASTLWVFDAAGQMRDLVELPIATLGMMSTDDGLLFVTLDDRDRYPDSRVQAYSARCL